MEFFIVQHVHEFEDGEEDMKFIGVYSSRQKAEAAVERLRQQPGFCETPQGFQLSLYRLDEDNWTQGYVTVYDD